MKISNETKIGILSIVSLLILLYGYNYLKGHNMLSSTMLVYAKYENSAGLMVSSPVRARGFQVGTVTDISAEIVNGTSTGNIIVTMRLDKGTQIPKNTIARIYQPSMMSGMEVDLVFNGGCSGDDCVKTGETLKGTASGGFMGDMAGQFDPVLDKMQYRINSMVKTSLLDIDSLMAGNFSRSSAQGMGQLANSLKSTMESLARLSSTLDVLTQKSSDQITGSLSNMNAITKNIKDNNDKISGIMKNLQDISDKLNKETLNKTNKAIDEFTGTATSIKGSLAKVDGTIDRLNTTLDKLQNSDGTVGMLLSDKNFANNLATTIKDAQLLLQDIRLHPERYRTVLSNKKKPYVNPENDPGHK